MLKLVVMLALASGALAAADQLHGAHSTGAPRKLLAVHWLRGVTAPRSTLTGSRWLAAGTVTEAGAAVSATKAASSRRALLQWGGWGLPNVANGTPPMKAAAAEANPGFTVAPYAGAYWTDVHKSGSATITSAGGDVFGNSPASSAAKRPSASGASASERGSN